MHFIFVVVPRIVLPEGASGGRGAAGCGMLRTICEWLDCSRSATMVAHFILLMLFGPGPAAATAAAATACTFMFIMTIV